MTIRSEILIYEGPGGPFEGVVAWDDSFQSKRPGVLIAPGFLGQSQFETDKAIALAGMGYVGFAIDIYGRGRRGDTLEQATELMGELNNDRPMLQRRMTAALSTLRGLERVDPDKTGAIGFCLGGKCVLDLARTGSDVSGVVSFHGVFDPPPYDAAELISAKILVLHGWDDPLAPPNDVAALAAELSTARADWQIHAYGATAHAFTIPGVNLPEQGMAYQLAADLRSWAAMRYFFEELFSANA